MKLLFWHSKKQAAELDRIEAEAGKVHRENISKIVETRKKVDKLNVVLSENNIVFELAHVVGGR